jgi:hypothetical protein
LNVDSIQIGNHLIRPRPLQPGTDLQILNTTGGGTDDRGTLLRNGENWSTLYLRRGGGFKQYD